MNDNENANAASPSQESSPAGATQSSSGRTSLGRIVVTVAVLATLIVGGGYWWVAGGGEEFFGGLIRPAFVPAQATVMWNGEPVEGVQIIAEPVNSRCRTAIGFAQPDGTVLFRTDTGGQYSDGIDAGQYRLVVAAYGDQQGPSAPPLLTPAKYASIETTDLAITVSSDPSKNRFVLELTGEAPKPAAGPPAGGSGGPPPGMFRPPGQDGGGSDDGSEDGADGGTGDDGDTAGTTPGTQPPEAQPSDEADAVSSPAGSGSDSGSGGTESGDPEE